MEVSKREGVYSESISGHEEVAIRLMDEGAGVEGGDGSTPLHWAVDSNSGRGSPKNVSWWR